MKYALVSQGVFGEVCLTGESVEEVGSSQNESTGGYTQFNCFLIVCLCLKFRRVKRIKNIKLTNWIRN